MSPPSSGRFGCPQRVGWANAMELLLTGKPISAERAKEIGLVWKLVEPDELQADARAWAADLDRGRSPGSTGDQGGGVAYRGHGVDRVGPVR